MQDSVATSYSSNVRSSFSGFTGKEDLHVQSSIKQRGGQSKNVATFGIHGYHAVYNVAL